MEVDTLKQALLSQIEAYAPINHYSYTADTPLSKELLAANVARQETTTELLAYLHDDIRAVLSVLPLERVVQCLTDHCSDEQLKRNGLLVNPPTLYRYTDTLTNPVVLYDTMEHVVLHDMPKYMQLFANSYDDVELHNCQGEIGGRTQALCIDCPDIRACDFVKLRTEGATVAKVTDYVSVTAGKGSQIVADGYSEVRKFDVAKVTCSGSVRLFDFGTEPVRALTPIVYFKKQENQSNIIIQKPDQFHWVENEKRYQLRLDTQHEQGLFNRVVGIHPHMLSNFRSSCDQGSLTLAELKQWICTAAEKVDASLANTFGCATTTRELLDKLVPHLDYLIPVLGVHQMSHSFNHEQLAERQIFVNDFITPQHSLTGTFYVFGNQVIDQPAGTTGHYYNHTVAHVEYGKAVLNGHSLAIGERAEIRCYDESLCYATDTNVSLYNHAVGCLHGASKGYSQDQARMYGYDQSLLHGFGKSMLLAFDDARVNGVGATAYATLAQVGPNHNLQLISDPQELAIAQKYGLQDSLEHSINRHR